MLNDIKLYFPKPTFRPNQEQILKDAFNELEKGTKVVIIEGPTGFGKSPVNVAIGRKFKPAFYTTPQVKLVEQLNNDFGQKGLAIDGCSSSDIMALLGRKNYICKLSGTSSDECYGREEGCSKEEKCTYWKQKMATREADIAILTFAMLIVNTYLPETMGFPKRKLLIIDECHGLEGQVASMFAGFTITPGAFRYDGNIYMDWEIFLRKVPRFEKVKNKYILANDYKEFITEIGNIYEDFFRVITQQKDKISQGSQDKVANKLKQIEYLEQSIKNDRKWIINLTKEHNQITRIEFKPIDVDYFLQEKIWSQAEQYVLSSATIPFRYNVEKWLKRLGLKNESYAFLSAPMSFPIENRPILRTFMGGEMTYGNESINFDSNVEKCREIIEQHPNERGVIHSVSFERGKKIAKALDDESIFLHEYQYKKKTNKNEEENGEKEDIINDWQHSHKLILISPSVFEGVDLKDDMCRYQILFKVPYPNTEDGRINYLVTEKKDWVWYMNETAKTVIQMYGRAVRSDIDHATFYIVDGSFNKLLNNKTVKFPKWFLEALDIKELTIDDYFSK